MPIGYLWTTSFIAASTALALWPLRRPRPIAAWSSYAGAVLNEMPFLVFYLLVASTLLVIAQSGVDSPGAWVAYTLALLASGGLASVAWQGWQAGHIAERALSEGLGPDWRASVGADLCAGHRAKLPWTRILIAPFAVRRHDVEHLRNISYGDAGAEHMLDVYHHRSRPDGGPVLIYLHGGGFRSGKKNREVRPLLYELASQGWVCVSANYRLAPRARFPEPLVDVKRTIAWARLYGPDYGADPSLIFVAGTSAGAHLASLAAFTANDAAFQPGFETADTSVAAVIALSGYYGAVASEAEFPSSPMDYTDGDRPPFLVVHGDHDIEIPVETARGFVESLRRNSSVPVVYAELPGAHHNFDLVHSIRFDTVVNAIVAFTAAVRSQASASAPARRAAAISERDIE